MKFIDFVLQQKHPKQFKKELAKYHKTGNPNLVQNMINKYLLFYNQQLENIRTQLPQAVAMYRVKAPQSVLEKTLILEEGEIHETPQPDAETYPFYDIYSMTIVTPSTIHFPQVIKHLEEQYEETLPRADYIQTPRDTGYQAIHFVIRKPTKEFTPVLDVHLQDQKMFKKCMFDNYHQQKHNHWRKRTLRNAGSFWRNPK